MSLIEHPLTDYNSVEILKIFKFLKNQKNKNNYISKLCLNPDIWKNITDYLIWKKPNIGDFCDAQDKYNKWFAGRIVGCDGEFKYLIQFNSWSRIHNEWIDIRSRHIMPLYSMTKNWRNSLEIGSKVEFLKNYKEPQKIFGRRPWFVGIVLKIFFKNDKKYIILITKKNRHKIWSNTSECEITITEPIPLHRHDVLSKIGTHAKSLNVTNDLKYITYWLSIHNIEVTKNGVYKNNTLLPNDFVFTEKSLTS